MGDQTNIINASPTKELFISMLIKDVTEIDAIGDLVDNSVDGALRVRQERDYGDLQINIKIDEKHFQITDNCGGIPVDIAREYVFRFGRPEGIEGIKHSIGGFGIGLKRALFKLGNKFRIESITKNFHFVVDVDVNDWKKKKDDLGKDDWTFEFKELKRNPSEVSKTGTTIKVTSLHNAVSSQFKLDNFISELAKELRREHLRNIEKELTIRVNDNPLEAYQLLLLQSDNLKPAYWEKKYPSGMQVKIYAGISEDKLEDGGWYIFCNERLILGPEQTKTTGWGESSPRIPKYHGQYERFRGYVFFDADDTSLLPWNTTKNSVDMSSPIFRAVRQRMIQLMRPVITFLNKLHDERQKIQEEEGERPLEKAIKDTKKVSLSEVDTSSKTFVAPKPISLKREPNMGRIQYYKPKDEIARVQRFFGVRSFREVGEKTFEYFLETEFDE